MRKKRIGRGVVVHVIGVLLASQAGATAIVSEGRDYFWGFEDPVETRHVWHTSSNLHAGNGNQFFYETTSFAEEGSTPEGPGALSSNWDERRGNPGVATGGVRQSLRYVRVASPAARFRFDSSQFYVAFDQHLGTANRAEILHMNLSGVLPVFGVGLSQIAEQDLSDGWKRRVFSAQHPFVSLNGNPLSMLMEIRTDAPTRELKLDNFYISERPIAIDYDATFNELQSQVPYEIQDTETRNVVTAENARLAIYDSATGEIRAAGQADPDLPTIVLSHGWQPDGNPGGEYPLAAVRDTVLGELGGRGVDANVMTFEWDDAYTDSVEDPSVLTQSESEEDLRREHPDTAETYFGAQMATLDAGLVLANLLEETLGPEYTQRLHLVGHSLGTLVSAKATNVLSQLGINVDQVTLLDPPLATPFVSDELYYTAMPTGSVEYVENFYASPLSIGLGSDLPGAALDGGYLLDETHSGVHLNGYTRQITSGDWVTPLIPETFQRDSGRPLPAVWNTGLVARASPAPLDNAAARVLSKNREPATRIGFSDPDTGEVFGNIMVTSTGKVVRDWLIGGASLEGVHVSADGVAHVTLSVNGEVFEVTAQLDERHDQLTESSPALVAYEATIPDAAELLSFEYLFPGQGDGDWLTLHFNDELLWSLRGENAFFDDLLTATVPISGFAGQSGTFYFTLNSVGEANARAVTGNYQFLSGAAEAPAAGVPSPGTLPLIGLALGALAWHRRQGATSRLSGRNR